MQVILRDTTLREGRDVPGLTFSQADEARVAAALEQLGVREIELGAPRALQAAQALNQRLKRSGCRLVTSAVVFASDDLRQDLACVCELDRVDLLLPLVGRGPARLEDKIALLRAACRQARAAGLRDLGAGFAHATSADPAAVRAVALAARDEGCSRAIVYDTNGVGRPAPLASLVAAVAEILPVHVHCHDDLGLALCNSLCAVEAGARYVDCTFHGVGDRAGNCALEPLLANLVVRGIEHGLRLDQLQAASDAVAAVTGLRGPLFPTTGALAFVHATATHLEAPELFEPFAPETIGARRTVVDRAGAAAPRGLMVVEALRARRSIRRFEPRPVPEAIVHRLLEAACVAPSSLGGRPWHFVVTTDRAVLAELARIKNAHLIEQKQDYPSSFLQDVPLAIVVCVDRERSFDRELENAVLAAANIMIAAAAFGLGSCYLSAGRPTDPQLERDIGAALELRPGLRPCVILPLGYPAETPAPREELDVRQRILRG